MTILVKPEELLLNCIFADVEHIVIANALNAIGTLIINGQKEIAFNEVLPVSLEYLNKHLEHEEKVLENALIWWADEKGYEEFLQAYLTERRELDNFKIFLNWIEDFERLYNPPQEFLKGVKLLSQQKFSHQKVVQTLKLELEKINPESEGKRIIEQLGIILSYVLNRVLKSDKQYVEFYKKYDIPACGEKPLLPPNDITNLFKDVLKEEYAEPFLFVG